MLTKTAITLVTIAQLALGPALTHALEPPASEPPAPEVAEDSFDATLEEVTRADLEANDPSVEKAEALSAALDQLNARGVDFVGDDVALEKRGFARLNLARSYQNLDEPELAAAAMDTAIREALGAPLPAADFGPDLRDFYLERVAALEELGTATIEVACELPCEVYLNENELGSGPQEVPAGSYRLLVQSTTGERESLSKTLELAGDGEPTVVEFGPPELPPPPPEPVKQVRRIMPLGAEIALMVVGTGLSMAGVALTTYGSIERSATSVGIGVPFMLAGLGALAGGSVTLAIDQTRAGQAVERRAVLSWTTQF